MDTGRFIIKKRKLDDDKDSCVAGSITHDTASVRSSTGVRQYIEYHLYFGLISSGEKQPRFKYVCGEKLGNQGMVPGTLKTHLHTKHSHLREKAFEYFKRLVADQTRQDKQWTKITSVSAKTEEASCAVAGIVTRK